MGIAVDRSVIVGNGVERACAVDDHCAEGGIGVGSGGGKGRNLSGGGGDAGQNAVALHAIQIAVGWVVGPVADIDRGGQGRAVVGGLFGITCPRIHQFQKGGGRRAQIHGVEACGVVDIEIEKAGGVKSTGIVSGRG